MGICQLDVDGILELSDVVKCDVTQDVRLPLQEVTQIKQHLTNYDKWGSTKYERDGIVIAKQSKNTQVQETSIHIR